MTVSYNYSLFDEPKASGIPDRPAAVADTTKEKQEPGAGPETTDASATPDAPAAALPENWTSKLRSLRNHTDTAMASLDARPWEWDKEPPADAAADKVKFSAWAKRPTTEHMFYTGMEGLNPASRINKENPVETIHAIVVDYDGVVTDENIDAIATKLPHDLLPTFASKTRFSGGCRLVWMLENPIHVGVGNLAEGFLQVAAKELKLKLLAAGFDAESLKPKQTFEVGTNWRRIGGPLRDSAVHAWMFRAALRSKLTTDKAVAKIPIEAIGEEVEKQYPGRWSGPFEVGQRGVVFFDPTSVNPTAAVVAEDGMVCFGQPKSFYPWSEILGSDFTRRYVEDMIAAATAGIYYDGQWIWMKRGSRAWVAYSSADIMLYLTEGVKLTREGATSALYAIKFSNRIDAALPYVGNRNEIVFTKGGARRLNTYTNPTMSPAPGIAGDWGDGFPWIANFLETRVDRVVDPTGFSMWHLLAWMSEFYRGMLEGTLNVGQAIGIVGGTSVGKTLFLQKILAAMVGGSVDAAAYLQGNTSFNSQLYESPLWVIDDGSFTADDKGRKRCSEILKKCAATDDVEYHRKYSVAKDLVWSGRVALLLNTDPDSILGIPTLSISNKDKFNLYKWVENNPKPFASRAEIEATITAELPFFLRWLLSYDCTEKGVELDARFGIKSYIESSTAEEAEDSSGSGAFQEVLVELVRQTGMTGSHTVSAVSLIGLITNVENLKGIIAKYTTASVGRQLRSLASRSKPFVTRHGRNRWAIDCDMLLELADDEKQPTEVDVTGE